MPCRERPGSQKRSCWEVSHLERAEGRQGASQTTGAGGRRERPRQNTGQCKGQKQRGPARHVGELKWGGWVPVWAAWLGSGLSVRLRRPRWPLGLGLDPPEHRGTSQGELNLDVAADRDQWPYAPLPRLLDQVSEPTTGFHPWQSEPTKQQTRAVQQTP